MADEKFELSDNEMASATGGADGDDKSGITYTCPNCGGVIKWKKFPEAKRGWHSGEEAWACDSCWTLFDDRDVRELPYFITKTF